MTNSVTQYLVNVLAKDKLIINGLGKTIDKAGHVILAEGEHLHDEVVALVKAGVARLTTEKPEVSAAIAAAGVEITKPFQGMTEAELKASVTVDMTKARSEVTTLVTKIGADPEVQAVATKVDTAASNEVAKVEADVKSDVANAVATGVQDVANAVISDVDPAKSKKAAK